MAQWNNDHTPRNMVKLSRLLDRFPNCRGVAIEAMKLLLNVARPSLTIYDNQGVIQLRSKIRTVRGASSSSNVRTIDTGHTSCARRGGTSSVASNTSSSARHVRLLARNMKKQQHGSGSHIGAHPPPIPPSEHPQLQVPHTSILLPQYEFSQECLDDPFQDGLIHGFDYGDDEEDEYAPEQPADQPSNKRTLVSFSEISSITVGESDEWQDNIHEIQQQIDDTKDEITNTKASYFEPLLRPGIATIDFLDILFDRFPFQNDPVGKEILEKLYNEKVGKKMKNVPLFKDILQSINKGQTLVNQVSIEEDERSMLHVKILTKDRSKVANQWNKMTMKMNELLQRLAILEKRALESMHHAGNARTQTQKLLDILVVLKLNGALGTKMGFCSGPRSVIEVRNGLTFLDLIVNRIKLINSKHGCNVPLILLNTLRTHDDTMKFVEKYSEENIDIRTLYQSQSDPVAEGQISEDEMCPFDLRGLLLSLKNSSTLDDLIWQGKEYMVVVNSDNLAAVMDSSSVIDSKILYYLIQNRVQYCVEEVYTSPDIGGSTFSSHERLFQPSQNAEMPDKNSMEKINQGNLWLNLEAMKSLVETDALIDENYSILESLDRAIVVNVPQSRFHPMMSTSDLLIVQSDLFTCAQGILTRNSARTILSNPSIEFGSEFEKLSDFNSRFKSIPSIIELHSLKVMGDVWFGTGITLKGKVAITAKAGERIDIPDGIVLENKEITDPGDI